MKDKAELILHPVRLRILLLLSNEHMTPLQLSKRISSVSQATLYRHVNVLADAKMLRVVEENKIRGTIEKVYGVEPGVAVLSAQDLLNATAEDHMRYFTIFVSTLLSDFSQYLERGKPDLVRDMVGYRQVAVNLSDEELIEVSQKMSAAILPHLSNKLEGKRRARVMTTIVLPDDSPAPDETS